MVQATGTFGGGAVVLRTRGPNTAAVPVKDSAGADVTLTADGYAVLEGSAQAFFSCLS